MTLEIPESAIKLNNLNKMFTLILAAHCINSPDYGAVKYVKLGIHDRAHDGDKSVLSIVDQRYKHPRGDLSTLHNDIGLIKLQESVTLSEFILPACLPTRPFYNDKATVTGFGETGKGVQSQKLMKVVLERFDHENCKNIYEGNYNEDTMLCYGHHKQRMDACNVSYYFIESSKEFNRV